MVGKSMIHKFLRDSSTDSISFDPFKSKLMKELWFTEILGKDPIPEELRVSVQD
jgi:hypothetical protein